MDEEPDILRVFIDTEKEKDHRVLDEIFIQQQQLYNQYVELTINCYGPHLRLNENYDCFKVFQGPTQITVPVQEKNSLNITGHLEFHSGLIVRKIAEEGIKPDRVVDRIDVMLDDYVDFLEPFRRSRDLHITDLGGGWMIHDDQSMSRSPGMFSGASLKLHNTQEPLRTDGLVNIVRNFSDVPQVIPVPFHRLLQDNLDVFKRFKNNVNIVTGHNLSPALLDEHLLNFIHELLTKPYSGDRNMRLQQIVTELNETHRSLVDFTKQQIIDDIQSFGLQQKQFLSDHLRQKVAGESKNLFEILVEQLSSVPTFWSMGFRFLLGGFSCVGTTDEDKYTWDETQTTLAPNEEHKRLLESLAFTLTFRVDMVYQGKKYFFSLILDREVFNNKLIDSQLTKGMFKQYELYKDIIHDSFHECIVNALDKHLADDKTNTKIKTKDMNKIKDAINELWPDRTFDLIQNGCAGIEHCMTQDPPTNHRLKLVFYTKSDDSDDITLMRDPLDKETLLDTIVLPGKPAPMVSIHLQFPQHLTNNPLNNYLLLPPSSSSQDEIVKWTKTVNDYNTDIIDELLQIDEGADFSSFGRLSGSSLSRSLSVPQSLSVDSTHGITKSDDSHRSSAVSVEPGVPYRSLTESVVRNIGPVNIKDRIGEFLRKSDRTSTEIPEGDCVVRPPDTPPKVGFFTRYKIALVDLVKKLFQRPPDGGGGSLHKKPRRTKTHTRRNKKYSRKKARHYNTYVKTRIKRRRRATYKK